MASYTTICINGCGRGMLVANAAEAAKPTICPQCRIEIAANEAAERDAQRVRAPKQQSKAKAQKRK
jgi:hypothetical protein